ncbi:unknown protein [Desulfotalea psychrophila LSv54]|uniref:Uncharacterized protein n=1 Tax=Desulfotalea psychrophila (strain LSv54 / DSM 12343) TaxID=177439 RepID=Q6ASE0_DESPS|nr:unknown protein [Desulfotalea psychrophila LSv54]
MGTLITTIVVDLCFLSLSSLSIMLFSVNSFSLWLTVVFSVLIFVFNY